MPIWTLFILFLIVCGIVWAITRFPPTWQVPANIVLGVFVIVFLVDMLFGSNVAGVKWK